MLLFKEKKKDLGTVQAGRVQKIVFEFTGDKTEIKSLSSSCGCTKPVIDGNTISVLYTPKPVGHHLKSRGYYIANNSVTVLIKNKGKIMLNFSAKVIN